MKGPFVASYAANLRALPTAAAAPAAAASAPIAAPAAATTTAVPARLPGGYSAQELLQIYQRYQKPGAAQAVSAAADSNS